MARKQLLQKATLVCGGSSYRHDGSEISGHSGCYGCDSGSFACWAFSELNGFVSNGDSFDSFQLQKI
ncbi:hypothetical protein Glove_168g206 [Diversispora epigaea]|uniref:Uncharacterized protein n=1 Tax=Diversispora epigaea TaxID=1348612 RepID=A0A397IWB8_9GLOM|nr:hypothetical protein Glove_168g206 [Diversispora epigaea]